MLVKERCRAPVLVGLSMGGYVVQEYAWQFGGCAGYLVAGATPIPVSYTHLEARRVGA